MENSRSSEPILFYTTMLERLVDAGLQLLIWGIALWISALLLLERVLLIPLTPPQRIQIALLAAILMALIVAWRYSVRYHSILIGDTTLEFSNQLGIEQISLSDVQALLGTAGISLDGGALIVWRKLIILTENAHYAIDLGSDGNENCYRCLMHNCPNAWGLPFQGVLQEPLTMSVDSSPGSGRSQLAGLLRYHHRQIVRGFCMAVTLMASGIVASAAFLILSELNADTVKVLIWLLVFFVVGGLLLWDAVRQYWVQLKIQEKDRSLYGGWE